ncbi:hypothetical protein [Tardiphaga sp. 813_E8_N1_3]|uniref:hypothetical protein n=1 Tax=Tardiphaga sp. 813_E8_N1_3 TaxID=3240760 RepID=UPI003F269CB9
MTVPSNVARSGPYTGNGVTTIFNYGFRIVDEGHLTVYLSQDSGEEILTLGDDYSVSNVGDVAGGHITATVPPTAAQQITILRNVPNTQETDLENQGAFFAETIERALDLGVMRDQQMSERLDRALTVPPTASADALNNLISDVLRLAESVDSIDTVASIAGNVTAVAGIAADVTTVAGVTGDIAAVLPFTDEITAVAGVAGDVAIVADNIADVQNFADVYQGAKAADPTLRNDGTALHVGDLYFNSVIQQMKMRGAAVWTSVSDQALNISTKSFVGNGAATAFALSVAPVTVRNLVVTLNGVVKTPVTDYTVDGLTLIFTVAPGNAVKIDTWVLAITAEIAVPAAGSVTATSITDDPIGLTAIRLKLGADGGSGGGAGGTTVSLLALALSEATSNPVVLGEMFADAFKSLGMVDVAGATMLDTSEAGLLKVGLGYGADLTTVGQAIAGSEASTGAAHDMGNAFDNGSGSWFSAETGAATAAVSYIGQTFPVARRVRRVTILQNFTPGNTATGAWVQYYNGSTWVIAGSNSALVFNVKGVIDLPDVGAWQNWRVLNASGVVAGNSWAVNEIEMMEGATGSMIVASQLLPSSQQPTGISAVLRVVPTDALTLNTDIFLDVSRDGVTWTQAVLALGFVDGGTSILTTNIVNVTGQPAGNTPRWRIRSGVTPKSYKIDGIALGFAQ